MKTVKGDLIKLAKQGVFDVIVHGCNCFNIMGAGIAAQIAKEFPEAYQADEEAFESKTNRLGDFSAAYIPKRDDMVKSLCVINAYTQLYPGPCASYRAIIDVFERLSVSIHKDSKIGIPAIGCGIGGLDWDEVSRMIDATMPHHDLTFVEYVIDTDEALTL
jgi:O-acetyl-ADP-ribose deacetylase (regulator of RNase III)